jgi:plastocyanin
VLTKASPSGDGQNGTVSATLANPLRVLVTQSGAAASGRAVNWSIAPATGEVNPSNSVTDANGIAATTVTLPPIAGPATVTATSAGASGSPQSFTLTATGAGTEVTVQVINTNFVPATFDLKVGGTVTFTWGAGSAGHNVTPVPPNLIPTSGNLPDTRSAPFSFQTTFPALGTFKFYCSIHGAPDVNMAGTITVIP